MFKRENEYGGIIRKNALNKLFLRHHRTACELLFHLTTNPTAQLHHRNYTVKP